MNNDGILHMDEKTPHIHATIVPIVTGERRKAKKEEQNGKKKYRKKSTQDVRLCADDVMARHKLKHYQDTYAQAMGKYGLPKRNRRFTGKTHLHHAILQGADRATRQSAGEHRNPAGTGRGITKEVEASLGKNQHAEDEECGGKRHHSHSRRGEFSFGRQQGQEVGSGERKFETGHSQSSRPNAERRSRKNW